jgi:hypothetical protein
VPGRYGPQWWRWVVTVGVIALGAAGGTAIGLGARLWLAGAVGSVAAVAAGISVELLMHARQQRWVGMDRRSEVLHSLRATSPGARVDVLALLRADLSPMPFRGRRRELSRLEEWRADDAAVPVLILTGATGVGKSRLALEFASRLPPGWVAGWLAAGTGADALKTLRACGDPAMILVDDADGRDDLVALLSELAEQPNKPKIRVILITSSAANLNTRISARISERYRWIVASAPILDLQPEGGPDDRVRWFAEAVQAFASALHVVAPDISPWSRSSLLDGSQPMLVLQVQALLAALAEPTGSIPGTLPFSQAAEILMRHEEQRWLVAATMWNWGNGGPPSIEIQRRCIAALALLDPVGEDDSRQVLRQIPELSDASAERLAAINQWVRYLYPAERSLIAAIKPRMLVEWLVVSQLSSNPEFARVLHSPLTHEQISNALTLLSYASDNLSTAIPLFADAVNVDLPARVETAMQSALMSLAGQRYLDHELALQITHSDLPAQFLDQLDRRWTGRLLPRTRLAISIGLVAYARGERDAVRLASALDYLGERLASAGRSPEALTAAEESVALWRELSVRDPVHQPGLASALDHLGERLASAGRSPEALTAAEEAIAQLACVAARKNEEIVSAAQQLDLTDIELERITNQDGLIDWATVPELHTQLESVLQELMQFRVQARNEYDAEPEQLEASARRIIAADRLTSNPARSSRREAIRQTLSVWQGLQTRRKQAADALQIALMERLLLPALRAEINSRIAEQGGIAARYRAYLSVSTSGGLQQEKQPPYIPTNAHAHLENLIRSRGSLSIGIAGPRGCGKSTLLGYFSERERGHRLSVNIPAPARYIPREFLLHLCTKICIEIIRASGGDPDAQREASLNRKREQIIAIALLYFVPLAISLVGLVILERVAAATWNRPGPELTGVGGGLLLIGIVTATVAIVVKAPVDDSFLTPRFSGRIYAYGVACAGWLLAAGVMVLLFSRHIWPWLTDRSLDGLVVLIAVFVTVAARISPVMPSRVTENWLNADGVLARALTCLVGGLSLSWVCVGTAVGLALLLAPASTVNFGAACVIGVMLAVGGAASAAGGRNSYRELSAAGLVDEPVNVYLARKQLHRVLYQRSAMLGSTASISASYLSIGSSASMTDTEAPLVMPDIVDRIKELLAVSGPAIICIDELDKLDSPEEARAFLNEVKGVFEAQKAHFLVSMSEDAVASFERRGLPFRDVFDSSFDEVIPVPYLSLQQSRQLLSEAVIGMPPPFVELSHCLAGGLVRDVIRNARRLADLGGSLIHVASTIIHAEIAGKVNAIITAAKPIPLEPTVTFVLRALQDLDRCASGSQECCLLGQQWLVPLMTLNPAVLKVEGDDVPHLRSLLRLAAELTAFQYYCRTLLETFLVTEDVHLNRLIEAGRHTGPGSLDQLSHARQEFSVNPFIAWDEVTTFRRAIGLDIYDIPTTLIPLI